MSWKEVLLRVGRTVAIVGAIIAFYALGAIIGYYDGLSNRTHPNNPFCSECHNMESGAVHP